MEGPEMEILGFTLSFVAMAALVAVVFLGGSGSKMTSFKRTFSRRKSKTFHNNTERRDMGDEWEWPSQSRQMHHSHQTQMPSQATGQQGLEKRPNPIGLEKKSFVKRTPPLNGRWPHKRDPIKLEEFLVRYQRMALADPSEFKEEFVSLPKEDPSRYLIANTESNKKKNRFKNILPYDDCRVKLLSALDGSDYINASYIQGLIRGKVDDKVFIATQGPLEHTIPDFWQMIWEQSSPVIVMLTNPIEKRKVKCSQYWPDKDKFMDVKVMQLECIEEKVEPFYIIRKIKISKGNERRVVVQYQFTSWDDKTILETAMPIWQVLDNIGDQLQRTNLHGSLTVHCSAGIGRTGTFIALSILRSLLFHSGVIDVFNVVYDMRTRRMNMVQMKEQYQFIYESLVIWHLLKRTAFQVQRFRKDMKDWWRNIKNSQRKRAEDEYKLLGFICPPVRYRETRDGELKENYHKNRFPELIPIDIHRPTLMTTPSHDSDPTNYINACFHHSFQKKNAFIATQSPLRNTVGAFWSMVLDYDVASIVELADTGHDAAVYCPEVGYEMDYGQFRVTCSTSNESNKRVTQRRLTFISSRKGRREMKQFIVDGKQTSDNLAESITAVVSSVQEWQRETGNGPIVVHCRNGIGLSGSFMAIYSAFDRLNAQHTIDVFTTVRRLRETRPEVIDSLAKYMMIYEALNIYLIHTEQSYSNFHEF